MKELPSNVAPPQRSPITMPGYRTGQPAPNKGMTLPPQVLTPAEVRRLLAACSTRGSAGIRDRALIVLLWRTALRISEALALRPVDVDVEHGTVTVLHGKGDRHRTVGIDPEACAVIERWLRRRRELGVPRSYAGQPTRLFCIITSPRIGRPLRAARVRDMLKRNAAKAELDKRVHPHGFRHTCAYDMHIVERIPVRMVQKQLGHSSLETTARYLDHLAPIELVDVMRARSWDAHVAAPGEAGRVAA